MAVSSSQLFLAYYTGGKYKLQVISSPIYPQNIVSVFVGFAQNHVFYLWQAFSSAPPVYIALKPWYNEREKAVYGKGAPR